MKDFHSCKASVQWVAFCVLVLQSALKMKMSKGQVKTGFLVYNFHWEGGNVAPYANTVHKDVF